MTNLALERLFFGFDEDLSNEKKFKPVARYYSSMDILLYLNEDCSYVADRVSGFFTVLWHPQEDRLVGIKLKGCRFLFEQMKRMFDLKDKDFFPLIQMLEMAFMGGVGEFLQECEEQERLKKLFELAREIVKDIKVPLKEIEVREAA